MKSLLSGLMTLFATCAAQAASVSSSIEVPVPVAKAYETWTTNEGLRSFLAPGSDIEARVGGRYNVYFFPELEPGERGAEPLNVMVLEPNRRLGFTWNQPKFFPEVRRQLCWVLITFHAVDANTTRLELEHGGFGDTPEWLAAQRYFEEGWPIVLKRFAWTLTHGAIDWQHPRPELFYHPDIDALKQNVKNSI